VNNLPIPEDRRWPAFCRVCNDWCQAAYDLIESRGRTLESAARAKLLGTSFAHSQGGRSLDGDWSGR
jgi:hypothetical protein